MEDKNFVMYEYATKTVKVKDQTMATDMYEALGWEITAASPSSVSGVTLSLRRDRRTFQRDRQITESQNTGSKHFCLYIRHYLSIDIRRRNVPCNAGRFKRPRICRRNNSGYCRHRTVLGQLFAIQKNSSKENQTGTTRN